MTIFQCMLNDLFIVLCGIHFMLVETHITIGIIARLDGEQTLFRNRTQSMEFNNEVIEITAEWNYIDTTEIYYIYRSIQSLDQREDIDVILLFDYDLHFLHLDVLDTKNKVIIKWGERNGHQPKIEDASPMYLENKDLCGDEVVVSLNYDDPYCLTDINASFIESSVGMLNDSITITAPPAISHIVELLEWSYVVIIHENATQRELDQVVDMLSEKGILFVIFNIDLVTSLHQIILDVYNETPKQGSYTNFVVLCRFHCARRVFRTANAFDTPLSRTLLKQFSQWLVAVYGHSRGVSRALKACASDLDNVVIIAIPEVNGAGSEVFDKILDEILYGIQYENMKGNEHNITLQDKLIESLKHTAAHWDKTSSCRGYKIDTLLWEKGAQREFTSVGYIETGGHVVVLAELFPNTKYGYNQRSFHISTLEYEPFVMKKTVNGTNQYYGFCIDLLEELANTLNFTYSITEPADQKWGGIDNPENLTFNGLIGELQREACDIVAAPISIQADRTKVCDFAYPFFWEFSTVVLKKPDPNDRKWRTMVDPFKWNVLLCLGISLPAVTVMVYVLEKYNPYYDNRLHGEERRKTGGLHYLHNAFWYMYGALLCQGGIHLPDSVAGRTFVSWWWIFCIIIVGTYCGNLIAFLTVTIEKLPFDTLEGLAENKGTYKWGTLGGTSWETVLMTSPSPTFRRIGDGIKEFNQTDSSVLDINPHTHIERVKRGGYAWIGDKTFIEHEMASECNNLAKIKEEFFPMIYAFGFTKNSPHTMLFSNQMMKIHEGGLLQIWKRKWWPKGTFCKGDILTEAKPISLMDVQSAFYVCAIGITMSGITFGIEFICFHVRKGKRRKCSQNVNFLRYGITDGVNNTIQDNK